MNPDTPRWTRVLPWLLLALGASSAAVLGLQEWRERAEKAALAMASGEADTPVVVMAAAAAPPPPLPEVSTLPVSSPAPGAPVPTPRPSAASNGDPALAPVVAGQTPLLTARDPFHTTAASASAPGAAPAASAVSPSPGASTGSAPSRAPTPPPASSSGSDTVFRPSVTSPSASRAPSTPPPAPAGASASASSRVAPLLNESPLNLPDKSDEVPLPPPGLARLRTGSIPVERSLYLDGRPVSSFALNQRLFPAGSHTIRLESHKGCIQFSVELQADEAQHLIWDFDLGGWRRAERISASGRRNYRPTVQPCSEVR